jgi:hypothetical protein
LLQKFTRLATLPPSDKRQMALLPDGSEGTPNPGKSMIQLREDCLMIQQPDGGSIPFSAEDLTLEFVGGAVGQVDQELLNNAAMGVLHYFQEELERTSITVAEFAEALAKVLNGLGVVAEVTEVRIADPVRVFDLRVLAAGSGKMGELDCSPDSDRP